MRKNPSYVLTYISGIPHLIPFGQGNADFRHSMMLNETGVFIWEHIEQADTIDQLIALAHSHYQCAETDLPAMESSIAGFVNSLYARNVLIPEDSYNANTTICKPLQIAGLFCLLYGTDNLWAEELLSFETDKTIPIDAPIQEIHFTSTLPTDIPRGKMLLQNSELCILETEEKFILLYPSSPNIRESHLTKDGRFASIYYNHITNTDMQTDILYAVRTLFLYFAQTEGMIAIHSASVLYRDKAWLFSAPSGVGKSTHASLWEKFVGTPTINGDLNLITIRAGIPMVHGTPWCGTSGIYHKESYPLGGVTFLQQGTTDRTIMLSDDQKQLRLVNRCISPNWTADLLTFNLSVAENIYQHIFMCQLVCTPTENAVRRIRDSIDNYLLAEYSEQL